MKIECNNSKTKKKKTNILKKGEVVINRFRFDKNNNNNSKINLENDLEQ